MRLHLPVVETLLRRAWRPECYIAPSGPWQVPKVLCHQQSDGDLVIARVWCCLVVHDAPARDPGQVVDRAGQLPDTCSMSPVWTGMAWTHPVVKVRVGRAAASFTAIDPGLPLR